MARIDDKNMYYEQKYKDMSKKDLMARIRYKTNQVNISLYDKPELMDNFAVQQTVAKLQGVGAKGRNGNIIGYGLSKNRSKESLIRQLRELDYAEPLVSDYEGVAMLEEKYKKARNTFLGKIGNKKMDEEDWRDMVETFGAISEEILEKYESDQIKEFFNKKTRSIDMVELMQQVYNEMGGKGAKMQDLKDELKRRIKEKVGTLDTDEE